MKRRGFAGRGSGGGSPQRIHARAGVGRFVRNTLENTLGLSADVCQGCRSFLARAANEPAIDTCPRCGAVQVRELCRHGYERFPMSRDSRECGKPAIACDIATRHGRCADHVER